MHRSVRPAFWLSALLLAAIQAWGHRYATNPDGLSYLDVANAFLAGDFRTAISPYWGPVYPALLALGLRLTHPVSEWVLPLVHAVNLAIFFVTLVSFDWFLQELLRARNGEGERASAPTLSDTGLASFAYAVFTYSALGLIGTSLITPDLCVAAACFASAALVLRMCRRGSRWTTALLLGIALGAAYLTKSVMFPLGVALLISLPLAPSLRHGVVRSVGLASVAFITVASLLIVPISLKTGGLTFGTSGKLTYAFKVNRVPYTNWQGSSMPGGSQPLHPSRRLSSSPEVFAYVGNLRGTYPPWFDPTYWTAGLRPEFHPRNQALRLLRSAKSYVDVFIGSAGVAATLLVVLVWLRSDASAGRQELRPFLPLIVLGLAGLLLYAPVYLQTRFIGAFAALLWILPPAVARVIKPRAREQWIDRAAFACAACLMMAIGVQSATAAWKLHGGPDPHPRIAAFLASLGLHPGDRVVNIGIERDSNTGSSFEAYWAYLAGVQIVAEMPDGTDFLCAPRSTAEGLYTEFGRLGARAVVTAAMPSRWCASRWRNVEGTDYYVFPLDTKLR